MSLKQHALARSGLDLGGKARLDEGKKTYSPISGFRLQALGRATPTPAENLGRRCHAGRWRGFLSSMISCSVPSAWGVSSRAAALTSAMILCASRVAGRLGRPPGFPDRPLWKGLPRGRLLTFAVPLLIRPVLRQAAQGARKVIRAAAVAGDHISVLFSRMGLDFLMLRSEAGPFKLCKALASRPMRAGRASSTSPSIVSGGTSIDTPVTPQPRGLR